MCLRIEMAPYLETNDGTVSFAFSHIKDRAIRGASI
jgi:hypothetical protein